jgi:spore coat protein A, manganese oxidase
MGYRNVLNVLLVVAFLGLMGAPGAQAQQVPLNSNKIPQFVDPLPLLSVQGGPIETVTAPSQNIYMREFKASVLPATTKLSNKVPYTGTWVWGYRTSNTATPALTDTYIGPVFVATRNTPTEIKWVNNLPTSKASSSLPFWWASTDQTLHWADPLNSGMQMTNYDGPVPAAVHLHGGEVPPVLDGGPDAWFTSDGNYKGPAYYTKPGAAPNEAIYRYPNSQEAAPIWFHDHALGITRLNVYAGLAGGYIITDDGTNPPNPAILNDPTKIIPIVIQDRMFDTNGQLFFPNVGINPMDHPFWVPEFVGDTIVVNGKSWPFLNVGRNTYRFLFLNGSNARTYELDLFDRATGLPGPPMWVTRTDGGYLDNPVKLDPVLKQKLVIMPGERYDVIIDFSAAGGYAGQVLELRNTARTPYPGGAPVSGGTTGRIMRFNVQAVTPKNPPTIAYTPTATDTLRTAPIERVTGVIPDKKRQLTLNEVMGMGGPLEILVNNTKWAAAISENPREGNVEVWEIINLTVDAHPIHTHLTQFQLINRQAFDAKGYTAAYNTSFPGGTVGGVTYQPGAYMPGYGPPLAYNTPNADGAFGGNPPLQTGAFNYLLGLPVAPLPQENGWKDTVIAYPGQVTRIAIRYAPMDATVAGENYYPFDPNALGGDYVWHCHIIDHEDNEMMRPTQVDPLGSSTNPGTPIRTYVQGADY